MNKIENAELSDRAVNQISDVIIPMIKERNKEIERLNNIINELEKELDRGYLDLFEYELVNGRELISNVKNYLQELKHKKIYGSVDSEIVYFDELGSDK